MLFTDFSIQHMTYNLDLVKTLWIWLKTKKFSFLISSLQGNKIFPHHRDQHQVQSETDPGRF